MSNLTLGSSVRPAGLQDGLSNKTLQLEWVTATVNRLTSLYRRRRSNQSEMRYVFLIEFNALQFVASRKVTTQVYIWEVSVSHNLLVNAMRLPNEVGKYERRGNVLNRHMSFLIDEIILIGCLRNCELLEKLWH